MTSINPYIKKQTTKSLNKYTFIAITSVFVIIINFIYIYYNNFKLSDLKTATKKDISICLLSSFLSIAPSLIFLNLIQKNNVNALNPIIKPMGILVTALIGIWFYNEPMSRNQIMGGIIILFGTGLFLKK